MDLARRDFALVSQWGIGKSGSGVKLFDHLQKSKASYYSLKRLWMLFLPPLNWIPVIDMVDKKLKIDIVHTLKVTSKSYNPKYLAKSSRDKVQTYVPDITGKTSPPWNYGIIHSKLMVSDRY